ncbi:MAG: hypothetical protein M1831_002976 [Alyxoria varia]|nr:MAG: hypothetical protein M1831_002976 [Alyxoria varia]
MCGITACIALSGGQKPSVNIEDCLRTSLEHLNHRGPDDKGTWTSANGRVGLGHSRLAIRDLSSNGHQPLVAESEGVVVVVNGELYDVETLRDELSSDYTFTSQSDSEVIIPLYLKYGVTLFSRLKGEFSFCLYDSRRQFFLAARDRYGIKPLHWTVQGNRLLVASEAKAFLGYPWQPEWDVRSIMEEGWQHDERTLFKGVRSMRPGYYMTCLSFEYIEHRQYWDLSYPDKRVPDHRTEEEMIQGVRERLTDAVEARLRSDVPVGLYLSGGIDSAAIAGIVKHLSTKKAQKAGLSNGDTQSDDSNHAKDDHFSNETIGLSNPFADTHLDDKTIGRMDHAMNGGNSPATNDSKIDETSFDFNEHAKGFTFGRNGSIDDSAFVDTLINGPSDDHAKGEKPSFVNGHLSPPRSSHSSGSGMSSSSRPTSSHNSGGFLNPFSRTTISHITGNTISRSSSPAPALSRINATTSGINESLSNSINNITNGITDDITSSPIKRKYSEDLRDEFPTTLKRRKSAFNELTPPLTPPEEQQEKPFQPHEQLQPHHQQQPSIQQDLANIQCFTIGFDSTTEFDEANQAHRTASFLDLPVTTTRVTEQSFADNFIDATYHAEHTFPDLNYIGKFLLSKAAHEAGYKVILSGEGADEHFGGYRAMLPDFIGEPDYSVPLDRQTLSAEDMEAERKRLMSTTLGFKGGDVTDSSTAALARRMVNASSAVSSLLMTNMIAFAPWARTTYGPNTSVELTRASVPDARVLEHAGKHWHPGHTASYIWTRSSFVNAILACLGDRMEMANSVEGRPPFLDHALTEYVNQLPPSVKVKHTGDEWDEKMQCKRPDLTEKWVLREAVKPFVTTEMYERRKWPFTAPCTYDRGGPVHRMMEGLVTRENVEGLGFLEWEAQEKLLEEAFPKPVVDGEEEEEEEKEDPMKGMKKMKATRLLIMTCQFIVFGQAFGVKTASPEDVL